MLLFEPKLDTNCVSAVSFERILIAEKSLCMPPLLPPVDYGGPSEAELANG